MVNLENEISTRSKHRTHSTSATEHRGTLLGMQPHHRADLYICTCTHRFAITHSQPHRRYGSHRPRYAHSRCSGGSAMRQHVLSRRIGTSRRRPQVAQRRQQCTPAQITGMCAVARRRGHGRLTPRPSEMGQAHHVHGFRVSDVGLVKHSSTSARVCRASTPLR